mgnify:FL=1
MKIRYYCVLFCVLFMYLSACKQNRPVSNNQGSLRDSVLIYKTQGLREFIKVADYWGDDTESYWAFEQANNILDSITDYSKYEESLARIYAATSYVSYGLAYVPSVLEASRQYHLGESNTFPKVGVKESGEIIIKDYNLPSNDTLYYVSRLEFRALYSMLYFYKAINLENFEERLLHNYDRSMAYEELYSQYTPQVAYRISSILNMQAWYNYMVTCAQLAYWENNGQAADIKVMPWKEFIDLAYWHDSLTNDIEQYENMDDETFHRIEAKAAYTQYIMLLHIAKNLEELKGKANHKIE